MQLNEPYERHVFRNLKQVEGGTVDQFITRLRRQVENCNWDNADEPDVVFVAERVILVVTVVVRQEYLEEYTEELKTVEMNQVFLL